MHDIGNFHGILFSMEFKNVTLFQENKAASGGTFDLIIKEGGSFKLQLTVVFTSLKSINLQTAHE